MPDTTQVVAPPGSSSRTWGWTLMTGLIAAALSAGTFAIYVLPAALGRPLTLVPEARVATIAREMLQQKNYVLPTLGQEPYLSLPPLPYWQTAISSRLLFGGADADNQHMARATLVPPAFNAALAVFLVIFFGSIFFGRGGGISAGLILAASDLFAYYAQTGYGDSALALSCAATVCGVALLLSERPGLGAAILTGFGLGLGILTKGHIPLMLIALPTVLELLLRRRRITWQNYGYLAMALIIAVLVATPWFVLVSRSHPDAINSMLFEARGAIMPTPSNSPLPKLGLLSGFLYYLQRGAIGLMPWTPLFVIGFIFSVLPLKGPEPELQGERETRFCVMYTFIGMLLFLIAQKKFEHYLLPLLPALALSAGGLFSSLNSPGGVTEERFGWTQIVLGILGTFAIVSAPYWPALWSAMFPAGLPQNCYVTERALSFSSAVGSFSLPLAGGFLLACLICARFWTNGRNVISIAILAAMMLGSVVYGNVRPAERERQSAFWSEVNDLKQQTDRLPAGGRWYTDGVNETLMTFYTGKPVHPLQNLPAEAQPAGVPAYIIVHGKTAALFGVPLAESARTNADDYSLVQLTPELEMPLRDAIRKKMADSH